MRLVLPARSFAIAACWPVGLAALAFVALLSLAGMQAVLKALRPRE